MTYENSIFCKYFSAPYMNLWVKKKVIRLFRLKVPRNAGLVKAMNIEHRITLKA